MSEMTYSWEVPLSTVIVERVVGTWRVVPHNMPLELFETRAEAVARATVIAAMTAKPWNVIIKPTTRPFYG